MGGSSGGRVGAGVVCAAIVLASLWNTKAETPADTADGASDPQIEAIRTAVEDVLKDSATAQESFRTQNPSYTTDQAALEAEGLTVPPELVFVVSMADKNGYCMDAGQLEAQIFYYYWSEEGRPSEGSCAQVVPITAEEETSDDLQAQLESVLRDIATAQESFRTSHPRYTEEVKDLVREGFQIPRGIDVSIVLANKSGYCMEASAGGSTYHYKSQKGAPKKGRCD